MNSRAILGALVLALAASAPAEAANHVIEIKNAFEQLMPQMQQGQPAQTEQLKTVEVKPETK